MSKTCPMILEGPELEKQLGELSAWQYQSGRLVRTLTFRNFADALDFVNRVGKLAEEADHHPDILLHNWNQVTLTLWTHDVNGLTMLDVNLAHKVNTVVG